jgi:hypothetical protein
MTKFVTELRMKRAKCQLCDLVDVRVRVTLQLTVSQSVCLGVEPNLGLLTRDHFFLKSLSCYLVAPSLARGRVCHLSVCVNTVSQFVYISVYR